MWPFLKGWMWDDAEQNWHWQFKALAAVVAAAAEAKPSGFSWSQRSVREEWKRFFEEEEELLIFRLFDSDSMWPK